MAAALLMVQTSWWGRPAEMHSMEEQAMNASSIQFSRLIRYSHTSLCLHATDICNTSLTTRPRVDRMRATQAQVTKPGNSRTLGNVEEVHDGEQDVKFVRAARGSTELPPYMASTKRVVARQMKKEKVVARV